MAYEPKLIVPPWKGVVDDMPAILAPNSSFASASGFWIEKQRLRSALNRYSLTVWPGGTTDGPAIGVRSFTDAIGNVHTVVFTANTAYYYVNGIYTLIVAFNGNSLATMQTVVYQNTLIATNGSSAPILIDGSANPQTINLPSSASCYFLGKLAARVLYLYIISPAPGTPGSSGYPNQFYWSMVDDANNFTDYTSGNAFIPEIEDNITGYATQAALGYIYCTKDIIVVTPTGSISPTFYLEPYTSGRGVGNYYPGSLAQYGNLTVFASQTDIHMFNPLLGPPQAIGGSAARSIYDTLAQANAAVVGSLFPTAGQGQQGLQYWLAIPLANNTSTVWMYQFDSQTWSSQTYPFNVTCIDLIALY